MGTLGTGNRALLKGISNIFKELIGGIAEQECDDDDDDRSDVPRMSSTFVLPVLFFQRTIYEKLLFKVMKIRENFRPIII